jgi:hypothetical protein
VLYWRIDRRSHSTVEFFGCGPAIRRIAPATVLALAGLLGAVEAQQAPYSEVEVKAAFLYHFGTYVEWPTTTGAAPTDAVTIAVLGATALVAELRDFLPGRMIRGRRVEVRQLARIQDLRDDEVLFIGKEHNARLGDLVDAVGARPVLIVTDAADGLAEGAMVNFQIVDQRVRFEVSLRKAEDSGLMLSSRMLSAALRVETSSCGHRDCGQVDLRRGPGFASQTRRAASDVLAAAHGR